MEEGKKERKEKGEEEGKGEGKGKKCRTHGYKGDFILCPVLCIALHRQ